MATRLPRQDDDDIRNRKPRTLEEAIVRTQGTGRTMRPSLDSRSRTPKPLPMPRNMTRLPAPSMTRLPAPRLPMPGQRPVPVASLMPGARPGSPAPGFGRLPATPGPGAGMPAMQPLPMPVPQPVPPRGNVPTTGVAWEFLDAHPVLRDLLQSLQGAGPQAPQMEMPMAIEQLLGGIQQPQVGGGIGDQSVMDWNVQDEEDEQAAAGMQLASALQALGLV